MRRNPVLAYACAGHFAIHLLLGLHATAALAIERDGGWGTETGYGRLVALWTAGAFLLGAAAPLAGWLADRIGAARMMAVFFLGSGAATVACAAAGGPLGLGVALGALGLFAAIYHPVALAWLVSGVEGGRRGRAIGLNGAFGSLGVAAAPLAASALAEAGSWRLAYLLPGLAVVGVGLLLAVSAWHGSVPEGWPSPAVVCDGAERPGGTNRGTSVRPFLALGAAMLCNSVLYAAFTTALPKWAEGRVLRAWPAADLTVVGLTVSAVFLVGGLGQLLAGTLTDRHDPRTFFLLALAAKPPLLLGAALAAGPSGLFFAAALVLAIDVASPSESLLLGQRAPAHRRGLAFGVRHAAGLAATPTGVWLAAQVVGTAGARDAAAGLDGLLLVLAGLATVALLVAATVPRRSSTPGRRATHAGDADATTIA